MRLLKFYFNPRSREGSDHLLENGHLTRDDFNPRSREGSDAAWTNLQTGLADISIHAPAKGATQAAGRLQRIHADFNPRSREGSDGTLAVTQFPTIIDFNPRSREGSDSIY